ncbi:MAG: hypothetical protein HY922_15645 [Elusimicrobia bacterium]|nr:hypothetical protein [Elusimicrobiota bacterium]
MPGPLFAALVLFLSALPASAEEDVPKPVNLWPIIYRQESKDGLEVDAFFSLISYKRMGRKIDLALRPFYWRSSDPERGASRTDVLYPMAMRERDGSADAWRILPLYFQKRVPPDFYSLVFPLYHYRSDASLRRLGLIGFIPFTLFDFKREPAEDRTSHRYLFWTYDRAKERTGLIMFPLLAYENDRSAPRMRASALGWADTFNLFEYKRDPARDLRQGHAVNFWVRREGEDRSTVFFPLYWNSKSHENASFFLWPLYGMRKRGASVERSTLWPIFRCESDSLGKESDINFLWPLARNHRLGARHDSRIFPLYAWYSDPEGQAEAPWLFPHMALPVPIWYRASGKDYRYSRLLYLHWLSDNPAARRRVTFTCYSLEDKDSKTLHQGLFPLFHSSKWGDKTLKLTLPLFVSYSQPELSATVLPPLYWRYVSSGAATTALFPVFLDRGSQDSGLRVIFPLYYHAEDRRLRTELNYFFPLYGSSARDGRITRHFLFFPLYSRLNDPVLGLMSLDVVWPLFHIERSSAASSSRLLPLFWQSRGPGGSFEIVFPWCWSFEAAASRQLYLLPLYGSYERKDELRVRVFGPFYWGVERPLENYRRADFLLSLYSRAQAGSESRSHIFPFYWHSSSAGRSAFYLPPLGGFVSASDNYRDVFFLGLKPGLNLVEFLRSPRESESSDRVLLYYRRKGLDSSAAALAPIYFQWRDQVEEARILVPLFGWHKFVKDGAWRVSLMGIWGGFSLIEFGAEPRSDKSMVRALLFYRQREGESRTTFLLPLYWRMASPQKDWSQLFPLFAFRRDESEGERSLGVLGVTPKWSLFNWTETQTEKSTRLLPFCGLKKSKDKREGAAYFLGFHPKFSAFLYETGPETTEVRVLFRFLRWRRGPGESAFELNPFYFNVRKGKGGYWAVLGGLFGVETKSDGTKRNTYFWFW